MHYRIIKQGRYHILVLSLLSLSLSLSLSLLRSFFSYFSLSLSLFSHFLSHFLLPISAHEYFTFHIRKLVCMKKWESCWATILKICLKKMLHDEAHTSWSNKICWEASPLRFEFLVILFTYAEKYSFGKKWIYRQIRSSHHLN